MKYKSSSICSVATTFGKETDTKSSNGLWGRNPCPPDVGPFSLPIPGPQAQALDKPFLSPHLLTPGLRGLQFYRLHREERPNYRLECLQWLKSQPQWPSWGWNQVSCPCSWQQGRWDLRFQPISIGDTTFPPPTSSPTTLSARALSLPPSLLAPSSQKQPLLVPAPPLASPAWA